MPCSPACWRRNLALGQKNDLWNVNADQEYHEEIREPGTSAGSNFFPGIKKAA